MAQNNVKFTSKSIRKALHTLEPIIGRATVDAIEYDFETYGLPLVNDHVEYSLAEIKGAIERMFGKQQPHYFLSDFYEPWMPSLTSLRKTARFLAFVLHK